MASEGVDASGPKLHQIESPDYQTSPLNSGAIISSFLAPPENDQDSQGRLLDQNHHDDSHNETDMIKQSRLPKIGPFISRPKVEDPVNFQVDFKYTKAPTLQTLSHHSKPPQNATHVQTRRPAHNLELHISGGPSSERDVALADAGSRERLLELKSKEYDANQIVSIPSDPSSDATTPENNQPEKHEDGTIRNEQLSRPPFQSELIFNKLSSPLRSPGTRSERSKLSKAFTDIQRKAIIQSTRTNRSSRLSKHPSNLEVDKASPCLSNDIDEIRYIEEKQVQEQPTSDLVRNLQLRTPETHPAAHKSQVDQSRNKQKRRPYTQDGHNKYGVRKRPGSQASNISMPRAPRGRQRSHAGREKTSPTLEESYSLRNGLNQCWNRFFSFEETRNRHWEEKIQDMAEQLAERDARLAEYLAEIGMKDEVITELKNTKEEQHALCQEQEAALAEAKKHHQKLQGKMKEYKDRLNDATNEQQTIFKYFQPRYHQLRNQLKDQEKNHQIILEQALTATDEVRDKIHKNVEEVRMLSRQEIQMLKLEIETLRVRLAEREKEVDREKNHVNDLRSELMESHKLNREAITSLSRQNQELTEKSNERSTQVQNVAQCINQQGQKIQSVLKLLEDSKTTALGNAELVEDLKILHTESLNSIISALGEHAASGRDLSFKTTEDLKADISAIRESCANLSSQIQGSQNASEWQQKFGRVQLDHQVLLRETDRLKKKLTEMREEAKTQLEKHESLHEELAILRATTKAIDESDRRAECLEKAKQEIQQSLNEKEKRIRELEEKIKVANKTLDDQNCLLRDQERRLHEEREKHIKEVVSCHKQQEEAIKQAKNEESSRIQAEYRDIQKRLEDTEQDCSRLQKELEQAKQSVDNAHRKENEESEKHVQVLKSAAALIDEFSRDLQASEQVKRDLNAKLEMWSDDHAEITLIEQAVQKLAVDQQGALENGKQLRELLDVQKKLDDTWQRHKLQFEQVTEMPQDVNRRVTIQSPKIDEAYDEIVPISIEDERTIRRNASAPKGIIKTNVKTWERQDEHYQKTLTVTTKQTEGPPKHLVATRDAKTALVSHTAYNRPVLGTSVPVEELANDSNFGDTMTNSNEMASTDKKRKRTETGTDQKEDPRKWKKPQPSDTCRTKLSRSMSEYFHEPVHEEPATEPLQPQLLRGGPIERRQRSFVTYGSSNLRA
ncbi:hypothetical protein GGS21DRAFT_491170 [Xylaria nigripes]|nr:hypothetical protein GGS21DRAFT_491170 [Xylaria nigripes]